MLSKRWLQKAVLVLLVLTFLMLSVILSGRALGQVYYTVTYHATYASRGLAPEATRHEAQSSAEVLDNIGEPPLVREGYEFLGWSREPGGVGDGDVEYGPGGQIRNIRADWDLHPVWDDNGGDRYRQRVAYTNTRADSGVAPEAQVGNRYAALVVQGNTSYQPMLREGYAFLGWNEHPELEGADNVQYAAGQIIASLERDLTLHPVWGAEGDPGPDPEPDEYTVRYTAEGATRGLPPEPTLHPQNSVVLIQANDNEPPLLREGAEFLGWSTLRYENPLQELEFLPGAAIVDIREDYLLHPVWDTNAGQDYRHTVRYLATLADHGSPPAQQQILRYAALEIADNQGANALTRQGYLFAGWCVEGLIYQPGERIESLNEDLQLEPVWQPDLTQPGYYQVTYHDTGATRGTAPRAAQYARDAEVEIADNDGELPLVREGFEFLGWSEEPGGFENDLQYRPGDLLRGLTADLELYPVWDSNQGDRYHHSIAYYNSGATLGSPPDSVSYQRYGTAQVADNRGDTPMYRVGCEFLGWSRRYGQSGAAAVEYWPGQVIPEITVDLILYPVWDDNGGGYYNHQLVYLDAGAEQGDPPEGQETLRYSSVVIQGNDSAEGLLRRGNEFAGWADSPQASVAEVQYRAQDVVPLIQEDLELYPVWDDNQGALYWITLSYQANLPPGYELLDGTTVPEAVQVSKYGEVELAEAEMLVLGHRFAGWQLADPDDLLDLQLLVEDTVVEATWQAQPLLTVTLDPLEGYFAMSDAVSYQVQYLSQLSPPEPLRQGYDFVGWSTDFAAWQAWPEGQRLTEDLLLYAFWQAQDDGGDDGDNGNENGNNNGGGNSGGGSSGGSGGGGGGGSAATGAGSGAAATTGTPPVTEEPARIGLPSLSRERLRYFYGYTEDGTVRPDQTLTRAEAAVLLYRLIEDAGKEQARTHGFTDVARGVWYEQAVAYLSALGILNGYPDGSFLPGRTVNRAEFVKMVTAFAPNATAAMEQEYRDLSREHWAYGYLQAAVGQGWLQGYEDGTLRPEAALTRAQAAALLNRLLERTPSAGELAAWPNPYVDLSPEHWAYGDILEASYEG